MKEDLCSQHTTATWFLSIVISSGKLRHGPRTSVAKGSFQFPHGLFLDYQHKAWEWSLEIMEFIWDFPPEDEQVYSDRPVRNHTLLFWKQPGTSGSSLDVLNVDTT